MLTPIARPYYAPLLRTPIARPYYAFLLRAPLVWMEHSLLTGSYCSCILLPTVLGS